MILSFKSTYEGMVHNSILFVETIKKKFLMIIIFFCSGELKVETTKYAGSASGLG